MKEKTLVLLAAGMGSRFGGMKQVEPVGPNGEFIMDYSIYSAIRYGFAKIVFVIKEEYAELFKSTIGKRIEGKIKVGYAFQKLEDIPEGFSVPEGRVKPWGTAHALYCARNEIEGNFGVMNADDFYGDEAIKELSNALDNDEYVIIGYPIISVLSDNGSVKRGIIKANNGKVEEIIECSCEKEGDKVKCEPVYGKGSFLVENDQSVSMLLTGFTKDILTKIEKDMKTSFEENKESLLTYEMFLPDEMTDSIKEGKVIRNIKTKSTWIGMTYKSDKELVTNFILNEINKGVYPNNLWN